MQISATVLLNRLLARARFRHMHVLVRLAELGSLRRTAEAIGMTQPGVTQVLADLEGMLGAPLFHRHARGVRPTAACADLLPMARQMLEGMATAAEAVAARQGRGEGVVRAMGSTAAINGLLVRAVPAFHDRHPSIQLHVTEGVVDDMLLAISRGELDVVVSRRMPVVPEGWEFRELVPDHFVVVAAPGHPLARRRALHWPDLATQLWLPAPAGSIAREQFDAVAATWPDAPRLCNVVTRVPTVTWSLLLHEPMLTLVPFGVVRHLVDAGDLVVLKMKDPMPLQPLGMLLPQQDLGSATARFAEFMDQFARRSSHAARR